MTATAERATFVPSTHPVRRAAIVLAACVVLVVITWIGGLVNPRLEVVGGGSELPVDGVAEMSLSMSNEALTAVVLERVDVDAPTVEILDASLDQVPLSERPALGAQEDGELRVRYRYELCDLPTGPATLTLTARTVIGVTRTVDLPASLPSPAPGVCP